MKKWKIHFISFIAIAAFMVTALACGIVYEPKSCDDPILLDANPIAKIDNISSINLIVLDDEDGDLVSDLNIDIHWTIYKCTIAEACPSKCQFSQKYLKESGVTDGAGVYISTDVLWTSEDENDRLLATVYVRDAAGNYANKRVVSRFSPNETSKNLTIYLLKNSSL